jgi:hypothetical protein
LVTQGEILEAMFTEPKSKARRNVQRPITKSIRGPPTIRCDI